MDLLFLLTPSYQFLLLIFLISFLLQDLLSSDNWRLVGGVKGGDRESDRE